MEKMRSTLAQFKKSSTFAAGFEIKRLGAIV